MADRNGVRGLVAAGVVVLVALVALTWLVSRSLHERDLEIVRLEQRASDLEEDLRSTRTDLRRARADRALLVEALLALGLSPAQVDVIVGPDSPTSGENGRMSGDPDNGPKSGKQDGGKDGEPPDPPPADDVCPAPVPADVCDLVPQAR